MRLYPPHILRMYVRNRMRDGLTEQQVARLLRELMHWSELDPASMDDYGQRRYRDVDEYLKGLESKKV